jgi:hypothetical protein
MNDQIVALYILHNSGATRIILKPGFLYTKNKKAWKNGIGFKYPEYPGSSQQRRF